MRSLSGDCQSHKKWDNQPRLWPWLMLSSSSPYCSHYLSPPQPSMRGRPHPPPSIWCWIRDGPREHRGKHQTLVMRWPESLGTELSSWQLMDGWRGNLFRLFITSIWVGSDSLIVKEFADPKLNRLKGSQRNGLLTDDKTQIPPLCPM